MRRPEPEPLPLTAILLVRDEEVNVESCLASIHGWCGEILVVDSGSTDRTVELCRRYTDRIFFHPFEDSASQWTWALETLPITYEWVLPLDADHVVSGELRDDLAYAVKDGSHAAYYSRHQYVFGRPHARVQTSWSSGVSKDCGLGGPRGAHRLKLPIRAARKS